MFKEKVNQKAIRSPSLRLRFGRRSDPDFPPNYVSLYPSSNIHLIDGASRLEELFLLATEGAKRDLPLCLQDLLNEEFQQEEPNNQQMLPPAMEYHHRQPQLQSRYLGFAREERKPARLRWGRSAPGQFSSVSEEWGRGGGVWQEAYYHVSPNFTQLYWNREKGDEERERGIGCLFQVIILPQYQLWPN